MHRGLVRRLETSSLLEHAPVEIDGDDVAIARELARLLVGALALDEDAVAVWNARAHVSERAARQSLIADDAAGERDGLAQLRDRSRWAHRRESGETAELYPGDEIWQAANGARAREQLPKAANRPGARRRFGRRRAAAAAAGCRPD